MIQGTHYTVSDFVEDDAELPTTFLDDKINQSPRQDKCSGGDDRDASLDEQSNFDEFSSIEEELIEEEQHRLSCDKDAIVGANAKK